jgi:hypothetical protein
MSDVIVYDKAKWHYDAANFPKELAPEQGFVHTGMFVGWLIERGLLSSELLEDFPDLGGAFLARSKTGPEVFQLMDGALTDEDLTDEGNDFAETYFDFEKGLYVHDYEELLCGDLPTMYHVRDSWENYETLRARIDERFAQWKRKQPPTADPE